MHKARTCLVGIVGGVVFLGLGALVVAKPAEHPAVAGNQEAQDANPRPGAAALNPAARRVATMLLPQPKRLEMNAGVIRLERPARPGIPSTTSADNPPLVIDPVEALQLVEGQIREPQDANHVFRIGESLDLPPLPDCANADEAYVLRIAPTGIMARGATPAGVFYASQTLRQLLRIYAAGGELPCLTIEDYPTFATRGIYIEGGQERFGRIVAKDYLIEQIRRLAEFKMNTLVIECYNLFPYASYPACADEGTLSEDDCQAIVGEARRQHVTIVPSLQTLAQASELVWNCDSGTPYREITAPGLICPSNPDLYPFIEGLYRDLLARFDNAPIIGIGCSEIDMQWQQHYCPACQKRIDAGETVRDLLLGHAEKCIAAVHRVSAKLNRPVRPLIWADEFYMYGPGKDWVGIERIPRDTVMGYWKYWSDYSGIQGLLERGYDVLGISAMYNHTFYLADLSPTLPAKKWPPMEQTGTRNITGLLEQAAAARQAESDGRFWGVATASFSKHRLRAFDSIWYGFLLNGYATWGDPRVARDGYQSEFTQAFVRHFYDVQTVDATRSLTHVYIQLDQCKSTLELANQTLGDVVGVVDTQEPGYLGNTLMGALRQCGRLIAAGGDARADVMHIREAANQVVREATELREVLDAQQRHVGRLTEWSDLRLAAEKIAAHAERQVLLIDTQCALLEATGLPRERVPESLAELPLRWSTHRERMQQVLEQSQPLYSRGDPLGLAGLLADITSMESHLKTLTDSREHASTAPLQVLLDERFERLDASRWIVLGTPQVIGGNLETRAPGGWEHYSGIASREEFELHETRPLVIEYALTPVETGIDSQLLGSANEQGTVSYRFSFYLPHTRFGIYTQSTSQLSGPWENLEPGWKPRAHSSAVEAKATYRVRAELTRHTWRVVVWPSDVAALQPPLWDTGQVPMDDLPRTRLVFADVEPPGHTAATRWGPITIGRAP
jgi:hypothetical protein